ncbi:hypothetical protein Aperf_G00000104775 [Anoplocephala perfoliata]
MSYADCFVKHHSLFHWWKALDQSESDLMQIIKTFHARLTDGINIGGQMNESTNQNVSFDHGTIIYQHEGDWVAPPEHPKDGSYSGDGPFLAVIAIGSFFLILTLSLLTTSLVFLRQHARNERRKRNATISGMNFETRGGDVYFNPSSEWRCSLQSDSFEDMSDVSIEINVDEGREGRIDQATDGWIAVNPHLCPKHSRIARIEGVGVQTRTCVHDV